MTKYCPQCDRTYDGVEFDTCPEDGGRLFLRSEKREDPLLGTVLDDRFRIESALSAGGMGAVYRATQLSVHREVALKVVRPDLDAEDLFLDRFFREAQVIAELSHPNIVRLIDFGQDRKRDVLYLVMELVRGTEMAEVLSRGRLDPALALDVVYQVCAGLTEPHSRGIVHRDLKPANIILVPSSDGTFQVKLLDFGIARTAESGTRLTKTGMICGTPAYLSPEQAQNDEVDERTDLYSLGVVLFEMLTGHLPFRAPSGLQLLFEHVQRPAPNLARAYPGVIPEQISHLVCDLMAKARSDRPQTAMEVRRRVQKIRRELNLLPVFLEQEDVDAESIEKSFSPWILPELDLDRLDNPPSGHVDEGDDVSDLALLQTLAGPQANLEGLAGLDELTDEFRPADTSDIALLETLAAARRQSSESPADDDEGGDTTSFKKELDETPESRPGAPQTKPSQKGVTSPQLFLGALAGVVVTTALLVAVAIPLFSDDGDEGDEPYKQPAVAEEISHETKEREAVALEEAALDELDSIELPEPPAPEDQPQDFDDGPVVDATAPDEQETSPDAMAEAVVDDATQTTDRSAQPGSARPPRPPTAPSDLEPSEQLHEGTVVLESPSQAEAIKDYDEITGDLVIRINFDDYHALELPKLKTIRGNLVLAPLSKVSTVSLPTLQSLGGGLMITQGEQLATLEAPKLRTIGQNLMLNSTHMHSLGLPQLRQVQGMVLFSQNENLSDLELPRLEEVGKAFSVLQNRRLENLTIPQLESIGEELQILSGALRTIRFDRLSTVGGGATFNENTELRVLNMGQLTTVGMSATRAAGLTLHEAAHLEELDLSGLQRVKSNLMIGSLPRLSRLNLKSLIEVGEQLNLNNNDAVEVLDLSALNRVGGNLMVNNHPALQELTLPNLEDVDDLLIMNNPRLAACKLQRLVDNMKADGWEGDARFINLDDTPC